MLVVSGQKSREPKDNPKGYRDPSERNIPYDNLYITTSDGVVLHG